ncbi:MULTISPECIES: hypothetical protein [unclassified Methylobacterium]|uniref:hypothetical protein n=1 Tax=unclassified Methylobacterium TaxID=2615210 RepID=UPI0011C1DCBE|nr:MULTISPECIES: hypothetical protein [unclassified Methylobacterium]QEE39824.1 hypothetical protein FVA80_13545 [Methylobacterium sp. WL1]TXN57332.1 hypothetical protein FV241_11765 [Methylobacterium sp. WL2]
MSDLHVTPSAAKVADLVDSGGWSFAVERWGWMSPDRLRQLANEGRRAAGRVRSSVRTNGSHNLVNIRWDGAEISMAVLPVPVAAAALGLTAATVTRGTA